MIIRLLPNQVPQLWNSIKFAAAHVDSLSNDNLQPYLNKLLVALMNDKAQCFIRMDEQRQLLGLAITRFTQDELTGERSLFLGCLYSFKSVNIEEWRSDLELIKAFARKNGCKKLLGQTANEDKMYEIAQAVGFRERHKALVMDLEA